MNKTFDEIKEIKIEGIKLKKKKTLIGSFYFILLIGLCLLLSNIVS